MARPWCSSVDGIADFRSIPVGTTMWSIHRSMALYLRGVIHPQAHDNYRVILELDEGEFEIGSIGIQYGRVRSWGIDTVIPMRALEKPTRPTSLSSSMRSGGGADIR